MERKINPEKGIAKPTTSNYFLFKKYSVIIPDHTISHKHLKECY